MDRNVVITGMGLVTPLGKNLEECWRNLKAGRTGIRETGNKSLPPSFRYRGMVEEFDLPTEMPRKIQSQMKFLNRGSYLGFSAALQAIESSGIDLEKIEPGRRALYIGSGDFTMVGYEFMHPAIKEAVDERWENLDQAKLNRETLNKVNPFFLLESLSNNLFSFLSAYFQFMGPNTSLASLSPCGATALELCVRSIMQGEADIALAAGSGNWITEIPMYELEGLGVLSRCRKGLASYRPLDRERDGFIPGEGGAAILLESEERAMKRGAPVFGRISGMGNAIEFQENGGFTVPPHITRRSMEEALGEAGIGPEEIGFICLHGSGTQKGDRAELESVRTFLGEQSSEVPLVAMKGYTGHLGAASDLGEIILSVKALEEGMAPGTLNFERPEREFEGMKISSGPMEISNKRMLSVSYGIGGESSAFVLEI